MIPPPEPDYSPVADPVRRPLETSPGLAPPASLADFASRAPTPPLWHRRQRRPGKLTAREIAQQVALGLLRFLAEAAADPDALYDITAQAIWVTWPPLAVFDASNPVGSYLSSGLVVNGVVAQAGLGLVPIANAPPYRYCPSQESAGSALRLLQRQGWEPAAIVQALGYSDEAALVARLAGLPTAAQWRAKHPRGRRPPKQARG